MTCYQIETKSRAELRAIIQYFIVIGKKVYTKCFKTIEEYDEYVAEGNYFPFVIVYPETGVYTHNIGGNSKTRYDYTTITFEDWLALEETKEFYVEIESVSKETHKFVINDKYILLDSGVRFTLEAFDKLATAVAEMRNDSKATPAMLTSATPNEATRVSEELHDDVPF